MDKFVKGFLSLLVNGESFTRHMVLLTGIGANKSGACCNIFIYLQWLILSARMIKGSNFVLMKILEKEHNSQKFISYFLYCIFVHLQT